MYAALWRRIPGGLPGKIAGMLGLLFAALVLLFFVVFPFIEPRLPWNDVNVGSPPGAGAPASPGSAPPSSSPSAPNP